MVPDILLAFQVAARALADGGSRLVHCTAVWYQLTPRYSPMATDTLLELTRLALAGDAAGARTYVQALLRRPPAADGTDGSIREGLTKLMLGSTMTTAAALPPVRPAQVAPRPPADFGDAGPAGNDVVRVERPGNAARPELPAAATQVLDEIIEEHRAVSRLRAAGLEPSRTVLLTGAPGVGKTMTARYIATATGLPLMTLDLAGVMSSLLGQSALNLRRAFAMATESPCVFFIDEVDALAKRRNDDGDIGELKRLVNVLLIELEQRPATGLLIAATNHPELLDFAIWRRFDRVLRLPAPGFQTRRSILESAVATYGYSLSAEELDWCAAATPGRTGAYLHRLIRATARRAVLQSTATSLGHDLVEAATRGLVRAAKTSEQARVAFCEIATERLGLSQREVARRLGVSHVQVGRWLRDRSAPPRSKTQKSPAGSLTSAQ